MNHKPTWRERLRELHRIWIQPRSQVEVRLTAIGWRPDDSYIEDIDVTARGGREYYKVIRKRKDKQP